ncbi:MAG: tetratricopeptide repeat protein [Kofleriaceae bacterium]|nr:tetratricopeptide repeat protein [Kofleriaceae bacterium]
MIHTSHIRRVLVGALGVCLAASSVQAQPASAGDPAAPADDKKQDSAALAEARKLYEEGNADYSAGRYVLAAERFSRAYQLSGHPALLFNLANTYERAGNYEKAAHYLRMYLEGGSVHDAGSVKARLQRLELAVVELQTHTEPESKPDAKAAEKPQAKPTPTPVVVEQDTPSRVPYVIAAGGLVAGAAVAVTFGLRARSERNEIDSLCKGGLCQDGAQSHFDNERRDALLSDIGTGLAVASAAGALIYFLATRNSDARAESTAPSLSVVPSTAAEGFGVVAIGRF